MFVSPNFAKALFPVSLGTSNGPKRKQKQCSCKIWGEQTKSIMVFSEKTYIRGFLNLLFRETGIFLAIHKVRKKSGKFQGKDGVFICVFLNWQNHVELFSLCNRLHSDANGIFTCIS